MRLVYVAGPYRAETAWGIEQHVRDAESVGISLAKIPGVAPVIPHSMYRYYQGEGEDAYWLAATLELLRRCDAVMMVGQWAYSAGSRAEYDEAVSLGMPIFSKLEEVRAWTIANS